MKHQFLPIAMTTTLLLILALLSTTANGNNVVNDAVGNPVEPGKQYYVIPYSGADGTAGLAWKENYKPQAACPEYYIYQLEGFSSGQPIAFYPVDTKQKTVTVSSNVNIVFPNLTPPKELPFFCPTVSNVWKVQGKQVSVGGTKGGRDAKSLFTIVELGRRGSGKYSLNYCAPRGGCSALGYVTQDGERRVVVNGGKRLEVVFSTEAPFLKQVVDVV